MIAVHFRVPLSLSKAHPATPQNLWGKSDRPEKLTLPAWVTAEEKAWIASLLEQKSVAAEAHTVALNEDKAARIRSELDRYDSEAGDLPVHRESNATELDEFFRDFVVGL